MPIVPFNSLPDDARIWIFPASEPIRGERARQLLGAVDEWLAEWKAHDEPLTCSREWRDDHFLVIGVDQSAAGASGCSIDALFRVLQRLQQELGIALLGGSRVFYRTRSGEIAASSREAFTERAMAGDIDAGTNVFDTSLTSLADYRARFALPASESWHRDLLPALKH